MKVLIVNVVYNEESTGKIVYEIEKHLIDGSHEVTVCFGRGSARPCENVIRLGSNLYGKINKFATMFTGLMYGGCIISTYKLIRIIKRFKPDIVNLHCINGNFINIYRLISFLKSHNIDTVLTLHAEFMYTANCGYAFDCNKWIDGCHDCIDYKEITHSLVGDRTKQSWSLMRSAFHGFDNLVCVSVSPWLMERASKSDILKGFRNVVILNGIDTKNYYHYRDNSICQLVGRKGHKKLLYVTASFRRKIKGGEYVLALADKMPECDFIIIGNEDEIVTPDNVFPLGRINDQNKLADYYSSSDLVLLTSKRETFGMTVAEALCCGTPVVGFQAGAPEQIALKDYCRFVEYGDTEMLQKAINELLTIQFDKKEIASISEAAYSSGTMVSKYMELFNQIVKAKE